MKVDQLLAEINEALIQLDVAREILQRSAWSQGRDSYTGDREQDRWLAPHKIREAITNLEDVLTALRKGLE